MILARGRSPNRDKAFEIYKINKGKIKNKDIAKMLDEDPKTVSKWKTLDEWENKLKNSKNNNKNSKFEEEKIQSNKEVFQGEVFEELNEIVETIELSEKQILFCIYFIQYFNATKAYQKAYGCNKVTASVNGCKLLSNTNIKIVISQLKQNRMNRAMLSQEDIFQKYMDIAFADMTDYITFGKKSFNFQDKKGNVFNAYSNYVDINESCNIDGSIVSEISEGRSGIKIKLADRMKALQWLSDHIDIATEEQKVRVEHLRNKIKVDNETLELKKKQAEKDDW